MDPALRISVFDELTLGEGFDGVTQVQGFHSESRAFHFQGTVAHTGGPAIDLVSTTVFRFKLTGSVSDCGPIWRFYDGIL